MNKIFIDANQLQRDSFALAKIIIDSGYRPTFLIGLWRGGCPIAITVQEVLDYCGIQTDHISLRVSSYAGIDKRTPDITVHDLSYIRQNISVTDKLLIVDDVHDTGLSMKKLIEEIHRETSPEQTKIAVTYYKPEKSKVDFVPDYYLKETNDWLVFPHELVGLNKSELQNQKPDISDIQELLITSNINI